MYRQRGQFVRWAVVLTIGFLAIVIGAGGGTLFMPGPLIDGHSSLASCSDCHASVADGPFGWISAVLAKAEPVKDSEKCLSCHMVGKSALGAHGMARPRLAAMTKEILASADGGAAPLAARVQDVAFPGGQIARRELPCATCHMEHRGRTADLTAMSNAECQACHAVKFSSFSSGHPSFGRYPYLRRTRIIFDHKAHFGRHFPDTAVKPGGARITPQSCGDCHELGPRARLMGTRRFDQMCAACHLAQITGAARAVGPKGVPFLSVPGLDVRTLREKGIGIGRWPEYSDAPVTPFMVLLLAADPAARATLTAVAGLDLLDLSRAGRQQLAAVERFAWAVKALLYELSTTDPVALKRRLADATGRAPDNALIARLLAAMPRDVLLGARRDWFPGLFRELAAHRAGKAVPIPGRKRLSQARPAAPRPAQKPAGQIGILPAEGGPGTAKDSLDILMGGLSAGVNDGNRSSDGRNAKKPAAEAAVDAEKFASLGGWYRQDYRILFRPAGHADPFLQAWLTYSGSLMGTESRRWVEPVFAYLTGKDAQGQCAKCHSVDAAAGGSLVVNWGTRPMTQTRNHLTSFSHAQHFGVVGAKGCMTCHEIDSGAKYLASFADRQGKRYAANFRPMSRAVCATCHTAGMAGDNCLQCHNYHVDRIATPFLVTKVPFPAKPPATPPHH